MTLLLIVSIVYVGLSVGFMLFKCVTTLVSVLQRRVRYASSEYVSMVSIVVPAYNESERDLGLCLRSCLLNDYPNKEVWCINDGSTNNTSQVLKTLKKQYPQLKIIDLKDNVGKREAMYKAIMRSKGEYLVVVDSDSIIGSGNSLRELVKPFVDSKVCAVAGKTYAANERYNLLTKMQAGRYSLAFEMEKTGQSSYGSVTCCPGCYSAYRKASVLEVIDKWRSHSVFRIKTPYGDDRSLTRLILLNGGKVSYASSAVAYTNVPITIKGFIKQQTRWKRSFFTEHYFLIKGIRQLQVIARIELLWFLIVWIGGFAARAIVLYSIVTYSLSISSGIALYVAFSLIHYTYVLLRYPGTRGLYGALYGFCNDLTTEWLAIYALCTLKNVKWGTR